MIKIENISKSVHFDQPSHTYTFNGKKLNSITTILNLYKPVFDEKGIIAASCAKRDGISVKEIKQKWDDKKNAAGKRGTEFHLEMENYINSGIILDGKYKDIVEQYALIKPKEKLYTEVVLFSEKYGVAGTTDVVQMFDDNSFVIQDWKTNESFSVKSKYKNKLSPPLEHLMDSHLEIYSLQLWCYSIMLEDFGYKIRDNPIILWINLKDRKIEQYKTLPLKEDARKLLEHHKKLMDW
jgi:hypothetical protein